MRIGGGSCDVNGMQGQNLFRDNKAHRISNSVRIVGIETASLFDAGSISRSRAVRERKARKFFFSSVARARQIGS